MVGADDRRAIGRHVLDPEYPSSIQRPDHRPATRTCAGRDRVPTRGSASVPNARVLTSPSLSRASWSMHAVFHKALTAHRRPTIRDNLTGWTSARTVGSSSTTIAPRSGTRSPMSSDTRSGGHGSSATAWHSPKASGGPAGSIRRSSTGSTSNSTSPQVVPERHVLAELSGDLVGTARLTLDGDRDGDVPTGRERVHVAPRIDAHRDRRPGAVRRPLRRSDRTVRTRLGARLGRPPVPIGTRARATVTEQRGPLHPGGREGPHSVGQMSDRSVMPSSPTASARRA